MRKLLKDTDEKFGFRNQMVCFTNSSKVPKRSIHIIL